MDIKSQISTTRTYLMGLAMIAIMLFHQPWVSNPVMDAFHFCGNMGVDIFFFVSGFGIAFSLAKHDAKEFYIRRVKRLMPLCVLCGVIRYLVLSLDPKDFSPFIMSHHNWRMCLSLDLWFFKALIIFYILSPLLYNAMKRWKVWMLIPVYLIALVMAPLLKDPTLSWGAARFPSYVIGMLLGMNVVKLKDSYVLWGVICFPLAIIYRYLSVIGGGIAEIYTYIILSVGIISVSSWMGKIRKLTDPVKITQPICWIGSHSLELYLWHEFVYDYMNHFHWNSWMTLLIALVISLVLAELTGQLNAVVKKI